jgi:hypothetical protein
VTHPYIRVGDVDHTPEEMFRLLFVDSLRDFLDANSGALILLVTNPRDLVSGQAVFPQGPLSAALVDDPVSSYIWPHSDAIVLTQHKADSLATKPG